MRLKYVAWQSNMGSLHTARLLLRPGGRQGFSQRCVLPVDVVEEMNVTVLLNYSGVVDHEYRYRISELHGD